MNTHNTPLLKDWHKSTEDTGGHPQTYPTRLVEVTREETDSSHPSNQDTFIFTVDSLHQRNKWTNRTSTPQEPANHRNQRTTWTGPENHPNQRTTGTSEPLEPANHLNQRTTGTSEPPELANHSVHWNQRTTWTSEPSEPANHRNHLNQQPVNHLNQWSTWTSEPPEPPEPANHRNHGCHGNMGTPRKWGPLSPYFQR